MANKEWHDLLERKLSRRSLLKLGVMAAGAALLPLEEAAAQRGTPAARLRAPFAGIKPTQADDVVLPKGYRYQVVRTFGDPIAEGQNFGFNNDYVAFFPIDGLEKGFDPANPASFFYRPTMSSTDGILAVNHEYVNPLFLYGYAGGPKTQDQINQEKAAVGMSFVRMQRGRDGIWKMVADPRNRRVNGWTYARFTGPAAGAPVLGGSPIAMGTVGNCSGGTTPWGTVLTCEENVDEYGLALDKGGAGWDSSYSPMHQGWVTEIDPYDPSAQPRKHTAMGRFRHENVAVTLGKNGTVVAYMGDDKIDSCVYKFVSAGTYTPGNREANMKLLESGALYVADFANGKWLLLDYDKVEALRKAVKTDGSPLFASQADVLADARSAALAIRGTPVDRPEDIEIHPRTGDVYIALTNNSAHGNFHGQIVRLRDTGSDAAALTFDWELFAAGGPNSGFSSPDNLIFDPYGNLWMVTDISSNRVGTGIYSFQGNNAMFFFNTEGPNAGRAVQFASGPNQSEMTGPCWTPDGKTMFLSVQHPGEESTGLDKLTSTWPRLPGDSIPRPSVIAISGFPGWRL